MTQTAIVSDVIQHLKKRSNEQQLRHGVVTFIMGRLEEIQIYDKNFINISTQLSLCVFKRMLRQIEEEELVITIESIMVK